MVKKYAELYLDARRALLPTEGQFASNVARELICAASGKTAEQLISDRDLYASEEICELAQSFVRRREMCIRDRSRRSAARRPATDP